MGYRYMANSIIFVLVEKMNACYHWAMESLIGLSITRAFLVEAKACIYFNERVTH